MFFFPLDFSTKKFFFYLLFKFYFFFNNIYNKNIKKNYNIILNDIKIHNLFDFYILIIYI